ncbi:MAG: ADP-glyceromanno-heptose 6-epimerase [Candidatus Parcubacteria bacterium]|nr:ADP-glyceromanno-heptose 6-epimerase [Burkholderiales bacterium]
MSLTVVTGAAGFIGSRLVGALNRSGTNQILAVDNLKNGAKAKNLAPLEIEDYLDKREFLSQLETGRLDGGIEAVLHQGACSDTMETDGRYVMENNYAYSKALFDWCQEEAVPFIYASSAAVYGPGREFGETRENEDPLNVYAYSKFLFDQYVRRKLENRSAQVAGLRYFNVYGPNEAHKGRMASVAFHAFNQFRAEGRVKLFEGSDGYEDGGQLRDFVHVDDAVSVNLWLLENRETSGIFNCGTGQAQTFNEVAVAVINTVNGTDFTLEEMIDKDFIEYIAFPGQLAGKYQSYTQADLARLREAGYAGEFQRVEDGVSAYVRELMKT